MKKRTLSFIVILSGLLLWGCYPEGPTASEDLDVVVTHHNPDYDFFAKGTYAMPDKIVKITGNLQQGDAPVFVPDATASQILLRISNNMESLGWQKVALGASPDLILTPASLETTTIMYYYDYWYWWYGGYPGYGWGYSPPVYYAGSYTTGTLVMTLVDKTDIGANGNPVNEWTGALNGILNSKFNAARVNPLIDQAFEQSQYLKTK
jgi:hypothetical protein